MTSTSTLPNLNGPIPYTFKLLKVSFRRRAIGLKDLFCPLLKVCISQYIYLHKTSAPIPSFSDRLTYTTMGKENCRYKCEGVYRQSDDSMRWGRR